MNPLHVPPDNDAITGQHRDSFAWDTLRVILEGTSPLELPAMAVATREDAHAFLRHYGFDLNDADDLRDAWQIHDDAVRFIRTYLVSAHGSTSGLTLPESAVAPADLGDLLVQASSPDRDDTARWACAVLRVMHTINHANRAFHNENLAQIRQQVLEPYRQCLQVDELGCPLLQRGAQRVPLEGVFLKEDKTRDSIILKLLHKPSNVAQDIYDWIGVQFVTRTPLEALLVVRFLRQNHLVTFANIVPGRSINNLVDLSRFRDAYESLSHDEADLPEEVEHLLADGRQFGKSDTAFHVNPFSGSEYRSIQFTCRQLIRIAHPARKPLENMMRALREHTGGDAVAPLLEKMNRIPIPKEMSFFFPYEIQILDYENYLKTRVGESSHAAYKKRQLLAARRRVLQGLI